MKPHAPLSVLLLSLAFVCIVLAQPPSADSSSASDKRIAELILGRLETAKGSGELREFAIDLQVDEGVVRLKGHVSSTQTLDLIVDAARRTPGVEKVMNEIDVRTAPARFTDRLKPEASVKAASVEFFVATNEPGDRLVEATIGDTNEKIYLIEMINVRPGEMRAVSATDQNGQPAVEITFINASQQNMATMTRANRGKRLAVKVDGQIVSAPTIVAKIDGRALIAGEFTTEDVHSLVQRIMPPPFKASMLLIKADWSQVGDVSKAVINAELREALKDSAVRQALLDKLPASGPEILFPREIISLYTPQHYAELLAWLEAKDLLASTVAFPPAELRPTDVTRLRRDPLFTTSHIEYPDMEDDALPFHSVNPPVPFVTLQPVLRWDVEESHGSLGRRLVFRRRGYVEENKRGQQPRAAREVDEWVFDTTIPANHVAIANAFPNDREEGFRAAASRKGFIPLVVSEPLPSEKAVIAIGSQVRPPDVVENFITKYSSQQSAPPAGHQVNPGGEELVAEPESAEIRVFRLKSIDTDTVASTFKQLFRDDISVASRRNENALIVRGPGTLLDEVQELLQQLDKAPPPVATVPKDASTAQSNKHDTGAAAIESLREAYRVSDRKAQRIASELRNMRPKPDVSRINDLRIQVAKSFRIRQHLHQAELSELQNKLKQARETIAIRNRIEDDIISRRVKDLLNPNLRWKADRPEQHDATASKPSGNASIEQRDPGVSTQAQLQLNDAMAELNLAKRQAKPDAQAIQSLEERVSRLRAMSRPIPTEPVYQGRTLGDWTAQMRFERDETARSQAVEGVLNLVNTLPDATRMERAAEVGWRSFSWDAVPLEIELFNEIYRGGGNLSPVAAEFKAVDRAQTASFVAHLVNDMSQGAHQRNHALLICADLRDEIRRGGWGAALTALETRIKSETGPAKIASQITYAFCNPDAQRASSELQAIDTDAATQTLLLTMFYAAKERSLEIPREKEIAWVAAHFVKATQRSDTERFWFKATIGPFANVDWDRPNDGLQSDFNSVVGPLLEAFEQQLAGVDNDPHDEQVQLDAALKSYILMGVVGQANLTGEARSRTLTLLERRLTQLLHFRATYAQRPHTNMDTPARVAVAIMLLTGAVPDSVKQLSRQETGYMGERLAAALKILTPTGSSITRVEAGDPLYGGHVPSLAAWYPYEMLAALHNAAVKMRDAHRAAATRSTPILAESLRGVFRAQPHWRPDSRLMLDYAATSPSAAEFISGFSIISSLRRHMLRHPEFAKTAHAFVDKPQSRPAAMIGFRLWRSAHSDAELATKLFDWLKTGNPIQTRLAIDEIEQLPVEWIQPVLSALDRLAEKELLTARDMLTVNALIAKEPGAARHAMTYLIRWLEDPAFRNQESEIHSASLCVEILLRVPEQLKAGRERLKTAVEEAKGLIGDDQSKEVVAIQRLYDFIY
jgi:hypothetical protein